MITIKETKDKKLITDIVTVPELYNLAGNYGNIKKYKPDMRKLWLEIKINGKTAGLGVFKEVTKITYDSHIYVLPEYQKKGLTPEIARELQKYLSFKGVKTLIATVPMECSHIFKLMEKTNFKVTGMIPNGIIYNYKLQDLIIFSANI